MFESAPIRGEDTILYRFCWQVPMSPRHPKDLVVTGKILLEALFICSVIFSSCLDPTTFFSEHALQEEKCMDAKRAVATPCRSSSLEACGWKEESH